MSQPNRRLLAAVAAGAAALVLAAVVVTSSRGGSSDDKAGKTGVSATKTPSTSPVPVIVPGRPGEAASTVMSNELRAPDGSLHNLPDIYFMRMMIPHHTQALEMVVLAPGRSSHPQLLAMAERIKSAQLPEIAYMRSWLAARNLSIDDPGHDHGAMPGMQSADRLDALRAARGDAFDRLFVDMMISHHQGAIKMATDVRGSGRNDEVEQLATNIAAEQDVEIGRMRELFPT